MTADTSGPSEDPTTGLQRPADGDTHRSPARRIGLFGGTFDPVHHGHLAAAWNVRQLLSLDEVWLVVANDPWQKSGQRQITPAATRLRWVEESVREVEGLEASAVEIDAGGASYTYDTITKLRARHPDTSWSVIVGSDVLPDLDSWHQADELRQSIEVVAVSRPGVGDTQAPAGWTVRHVSIPPLDVSSTQLRALAAGGRLLHFLIPNGVADDIAASGAYRSVDGSGSANA